MAAITRSAVVSSFRSSPTADAQTQRLVEASLELRHLGVDPAEDLDRAVLWGKYARQVSGAPSGDVTQGDVGVSHAARGWQVACQQDGAPRSARRRGMLGHEGRSGGGGAMAATALPPCGPPGRALS
ncbi:hypothetical protein WME76_18265 [Sorangium sp. So ce119]|uniref:hypothetical protein n=1 Tax=Sorangium sp. So ce119 TaxID=3133279 RepID=UPI003F60D2F2